MLVEPIRWSEVHDPRLLQVRAFVMRNLNRRVSLAEAAAVAGLSRTHFSVWFKQHTGVNFSVWDRWLGVKEATQLLPNLRLSTLDVADLVGWDERTLTRNFKRILSETPGRWRRPPPGQPRSREGED